MMGGADRSKMTPMPNGNVRMRSGGRIGTRRMERWFERDPWSPSVTEWVNSSRSPISVERSWRSREFEAPPRMIFAILASQIAAALFSDHLSRAWARDWSTGIVVMPVPPPSAMSVGSEGSGVNRPGFRS